MVACDRGEKRKINSPWWPERKRNVQMGMVGISGQIPVMLPPSLNRQCAGLPGTEENSHN